MASWPWEKRWLYYDSLQALTIEEQQEMPEYDSSGMPADADVPSQFKGNMPTGGMSQMGGNQTTKNVTPEVGKHDNIIKSKNH